ncbi:hypothetical protein B0H16DRAFT_358890 [Mycena metata]|uniref:Uncharacterized protein n=1 Tax=Mycena metata TaxID=1033252 RepID=A0AAD7MLX6_9AGAR|nr:hypothetical protein B0H16DRAFT_358890 [Mycena metata]
MDTPDERDTPNPVKMDTLIALVSNQLTLGRRTKNIPCIRHGLQFMTNSGLARTPVDASLRVRELNTLLPEIICTLAEMKSEDGARETLTQCVELLSLGLSNLRDFHFFYARDPKGSASCPCAPGPRRRHFIRWLAFCLPANHRLDRGQLLLFCAPANRRVPTRGGDFG